MSKMLIDEIDLYYERSGQGAPLLFVHGLGSSTRDWEPQVKEFSKNYQVIAFDLRGHGQSDKPAGPYSMPLFASDTAGLLRALGIEAAHIVGISLGGAVALQLALDSPKLVKTLTIVNSAPSLGGTPEQAKAEIDRRVGIVRQTGMRAMGEALAPNLFPKAEHEALRRAFIESWAQNDPRAYIDSTLSMLGWDVTGQVNTIRCPTLILASDQDYTPPASKEAYARLMPEAQLVVISDAHHAVPMEAPDKFNAALKEFLSKHS
ncbi:MAG TPA: alpha/beta hydrolase [Anaerolineales bacterium]|nr:alpha/beta hydrolase [Anaerolineales bacterium]